MILTGSDYAREIRLRARSTGAPVDLTGFALGLCVKAQRGDPAALRRFALGDGLSVADPASGVVTLAMSADDTTQIGAGQRVWALYRTDGGRKLALATGKMRVLAGI